MHNLPGNLTPNPSTESASTTNYAIPSDNPFVGATTFDNLPVNPGQLRTEFWAVGLRNPWRYSFDSVTGFLYCGDVGQDQYEEVDVITKGGNYGWATWEGSNTPPGGVSTNGQPVPLNPIFPIYSYAHSSLSGPGNCIIGGVVYRGSRFPNLYGSYVFGDYVSGAFWRMNYDGTNTTTPQILFHDPGVSAFGTDPANGDVLYCNLQGGNNSVIKRIISTNSVPYINAITFFGTNVVISGTNGPANGMYSVLVSTNVISPVATWGSLSTNPFDGNGNFIFTNPVTLGIPALFYLLQLH